jgi:hypothetical protein
MNWKTIRLELAGTRDFPVGSVSRGYLIRMPLNESGLIDEVSLAEAPQRATVRRFWSTEPDESGRVVRANGHWVLRCKGKPDRLLASASPSFSLGEAVAVQETSGPALPFRVASVRRFG